VTFGTTRDRFLEVPRVEPKSWDRFPEEPEAAWAYFVRYRNQAPPRNIRGLAAELGMHEDTLHGYSAHFEWRARCEDYDAWRDRKAQQGAAIEAKQQGHKRMRKQLKTAMMAIEIANRKFKKTLELAEKDGDASLSHEVNMHAAARLLKEGSHLARLIDGLATERVEEAKSDLSKLSDEELAELDRLQRKSEGRA
jgi:hypothetical protein